MFKLGETGGKKKGIFFLFVCFFLNMGTTIFLAVKENTWNVYT